MSSTSPPPRRRFLPQPVETSTRTSKRQHVESPETDTTAADNADTKDDTMAPVTKPRRFLPQPIEETTRSSRKKKVEKDKITASEDTAPTNSSTAPHTQSENSTMTEQSTSKPSTSSRRFAPEPVETTTRSSRRKFAVEPVETTTKSSKDRKKKDEEQDASSSGRPRRKFAPEPVETTTIRRRKKDVDDDSNESPPDSPSETSSRVSSRQSTGSRRFSPELIETAKGSYRHKNHSDSPKSERSRASSPPLSRTVTKSPEPSEQSDPSESRFSAAALAKRCHEEHRRHSYCVPNLPIIESESSSDESSAPSITELSSTTDVDQHKLARIEETNTESFTDYVFSLANSNDRKQLMEQAMAAYVNERPHEPVSHFGHEEDEEDAVGTLSSTNGVDPKTFRRSSQDEHDWEMENMRKHHEQLEKAKKELHEDTAGASRFSAAALAARHHLGQVHKHSPKVQRQKDDAEYARMKKAASPPMLGDDLVFPFTISPKMTRCDVDQAPRPRRADSDEDYTPSTEASQPLWSGKTNVQNNQGAGLWMGMCQKPPEPSRPPTPTRSGLQTPAFEAANPFEAHTPRGSRTPGRRLLPRPYSGQFLMPLTPARSNDDEFVSSVDKKLRLEKQIEEEFTPKVITQIYNYLSLGFPSLARDFDAELSKISRIPVKELRKDDDIAKGTIKGHVGCPESESAWEEDEDGTVRGCKRWEALRLYVKEWARQSPNFQSEKARPVPQDPALAHLKSVKADAWGATVRKGSWAQ